MTQKRLSDFFSSVSKLSRNENEDKTVEQLELDQKEKQDLTNPRLKEKFTPEWPFIFFTPIKSLYKNMLFTKISASNER